LNRHKFAVAAPSLFVIFVIHPMNMSLQIKGLTIVGAMLAAAGIILMFFFQDMSENALMGASTRYKPAIPAPAASDFSKAPQCAPGYDRPWIGCQNLSGN
jgi:hypothetical protein